MDLRDLRDRVAVVGVGNSQFGLKLGKDPYDLALEAFKNALDDCGLPKSLIDGFNSVGIDFDKTVRVFGLNALYGSQMWHHGRLTSNIVVEAVLALSTGLANYWIIIKVGDAGTRRIRLGDEGVDPIFKTEGSREGGGPHGEDPVFGLTAPMAMLAFWARRYFHLYNISYSDLGLVAVSLRKWASLNPNAIMRKPITIDDYLESKIIIDPIRILDCSLLTDGAVCLILTTAERAKELKKPPVYISGMSPVGVSPVPYIKDMAGLEGPGKVGLKERMSQTNVGRSFRMAGIEPKDLNAFYCYDVFSPAILLCLEMVGLCPAGEAIRLFRSGMTDPGGRLPVNPNGGFLSEVHLGGWNHMADIVRQLRGECGPRQIKDARFASFSGTFGDTIIFRR